MSPPKPHHTFLNPLSAQCEPEKEPPRLFHTCAPSTPPHTPLLRMFFVTHTAIIHPLARKCFKEQRRREREMDGNEREKLREMSGRKLKFEISVIVLRFSSAFFSLSLSLLTAGLEIEVSLLTLRFTQAKSASSAHSCPFLPPLRKNEWLSDEEDSLKNLQLEMSTSASPFLLPKQVVQEWALKKCSGETSAVTTMNGGFVSLLVRFYPLLLRRQQKWAAGSTPRGSTTTTRAEKLRSATSTLASSALERAAQKRLRL